MSAAPALECTDLHVRRGGTVVLDGVAVAARWGEWVSVVGPNGAGKTTLLHALAGLVAADGRIVVAGRDPRRSTRRAMARAVALMPQRPVVPEGMSVDELVRLGRTPHRGRFATESAADRAAARSAIERLGLGALAERPASELSGGELQRVVLARALAQEPAVLLLDEPTSALDIGHQQTVLDLVDELRLERRITVLAAMHDLTLAAQYGSRLVLLDGGRVVADAAPAEVLDVDRLARVYAARVEVMQRAAGPAVLPLRSAAAEAVRR